MAVHEVRTQAALALPLLAQDWNDFRGNQKTVAAMVQGSASDADFQEGNQRPANPSDARIRLLQNLLVHVHEASLFAARSGFSATDGNRRSGRDVPRRQSAKHARQEAQGTGPD